jgi:anti-sigma factor RsiW
METTSMKHVRQTDLIRLAADELAEPRRAEVERHLSACPACRELYQRQVATWRALGEWAPEIGQADLLAGIGRGLGPPRVMRHPLWAGIQRFSRVAAAVIVGVGAGYGATLVWPPARPSQPAVASAADESAATDQLGVGYLADESPAGLFAALQDISAMDDSREDQS